MIAPSTHIQSSAVSNASATFNEMHQFIGRVTDGLPDQLVGIYAPGKFEHPVVQQPDGQPVYVSTNPDQITQFGLPSQFGSVGLLAHNSLAGGDFFRLEIGSPVYLVYGDGSTRSYAVTSIRRYQALDPENPYSVFVDPHNPNRQLTSGDLFKIVYTQAKSVVLQTCIEEDGDASWGRIFITAEETTQNPFSSGRPARLASLRKH